MIGLTKAVCAVMADVKNVEKTGQNDFHRYAYASEADLLRALQPAMAQHGLMMAPVKIDVSYVEETGKQGDQVRCDAVVTYRLQHTSGESIEVVALGQGSDKADKAAYKAMTGALKYALRQTFLIPTGDDPDKGASLGSDDQVPSKAPAPAAPAPAPAPTAKGSPEVEALRQRLAGLVKTHGMDQVKRVVLRPAGVTGRLWDASPEQLALIGDGIRVLMNGDEGV